AGRLGTSLTKDRCYETNLLLPFRAACSLIDVIDTLLPHLASSTCRSSLFSPANDLGCPKEHWRMFRGSEPSAPTKEANLHRINAPRLVWARLPAVPQRLPRCDAGARACGKDVAHVLKGPIVMSSEIL